MIMTEERVKEFLRAILAHGKDEDGDERDLLAIFRAAITIFGIKCKPGQTDDPVIVLLYMLSMQQAFKTSGGGVVFNRGHMPLLHHDPTGGPWTLTLNIDPDQGVSQDNSGSILLDGEFEAFSKFSLMWDTAPQQGVFSAIRTDNDAEVTPTPGDSTARIDTTPEARMQNGDTQPWAG